MKSGGGHLGDGAELSRAYLEAAWAIEALQQKLDALMSAAGPSSGCECCANCRVRGPVENLVGVDGRTRGRVFCYQTGQWRPVEGWCPLWPELNVRE